MAIEPSNQFMSIIGANYSKCPGCNRDYVTDSSPVSSVNDKTKICQNCSAKEQSLTATLSMDPSGYLDSAKGGDLKDFVERDFPAARRMERDQEEASQQLRSHDSRVKNSEVPLPEPTTVGKWQVNYRRNPTTGHTEASAEADHSYSAHDAILDHDTGEVRFGLYGTDLPPKNVQKHIKKVLSAHYDEHLRGRNEGTDGN